MRTLAQAMGLDHPALGESDEEIAASALPPGLEMATLKQTGWVKIDKPRPQLDGAGLRLARGVPLPPARPAAGMLQLLTPKAHYFLNSSFVNQPRQRAPRAAQRWKWPRPTPPNEAWRTGKPSDCGMRRVRSRPRFRITDAVAPARRRPPGQVVGAARGGRRGGEPAQPLHVVAQRSAGIQ